MAKKQQWSSGNLVGDSGTVVGLHGINFGGSQAEVFTSQKNEKLDKISCKISQLSVPLLVFRQIDRIQVAVNTKRNHIL